MRLSRDKLILPIILLPSASLSFRLLIDALFWLPFFAKTKFKVLSPRVILIVLAAMCLLTQSFMSVSFNNLLELGRVIPLILISVCLSEIRNKEKIPTLFLHLLIINLLVSVGNYTFSAELLTKLGFNDAPFYELYGRNSGAFAFLSAAGLLSFINLYFLMSSNEKWPFRLFWFFLVLAGLAVSGSKTYMLVGTLLVVSFLILKTPAGLKRPEKILGLFVFSTIVAGVFYSVLTKLKFQVLYQISRLGIFLATGSLSSVTARFEKVEMYLSVQNQNSLFQLIGTPKELLVHMNGTFDNDYLFFFVRLGVPLTLLAVMLLLSDLLKFIKLKLFFVAITILLLMVAAAAIPILSDIQSSILVVILGYYFSLLANEKRKKSIHV